MMPDKKAPTIPDRFNVDAGGVATNISNPLVEMQTRLVLQLIFYRVVMLIWKEVSTRSRLQAIDDRSIINLRNEY